MVPIIQGFKLHLMRPQRTLKLLYLANLMPTKGIEDVLLALKELKKRGVTSVTSRRCGQLDKR